MCRTCSSLPPELPPVNPHHPDFSPFLPPRSLSCCSDHHPPHHHHHHLRNQLLSHLSAGHCPINLISLRAAATFGGFFLPACFQPPSPRSSPECLNPTPAGPAAAQQLFTLPLSSPCCSPFPHRGLPGSHGASGLGVARSLGTLGAGRVGKIPVSDATTTSGGLEE